MPLINFFFVVVAHNSTLEKGFRGNITSLSSCGIQYQILAVLSAQGPLFIGSGLKWASGKIYLGTVRTVDMGRPDGQLYDKIF